MEIFFNHSHPSLKVGNVLQINIRRNITNFPMSALSYSPPWVTFGLCCTLILIYLLPATFQHFHYNSSLVTTGQWWRIITSQFVHLDLSHLSYNIVALMILGVILENNYRQQIVLFLVASVSAIGCYLLISDLMLYCGISGAINALVPPAVFSMWRQTRSFIPLLLGAIHIGRIVFEFFVESSLISNLDWPSHPPVHLIGLAVGFAGIIFQVSGRARTDNNKTHKSSLENTPETFLEISPNPKETNYFTSETI